MLSVFAATTTNCDVGVIVDVIALLSLVGCFLFVVMNCFMGVTVFVDVDPSCCFGAACCMCYVLCISK